MVAAHGPECRLEWAGFRDSRRIWPGQGVAGRARRRAKTRSSTRCPGGRRRVSAPAWRTSRAGTRISRCRRVAIMAWSTP